jgi:hypothetical protein
MSSCDHASSDGIRHSRATITLTISQDRAPASAHSPHRHLPAKVESLQVAMRREARDRRIRLCLWTGAGFDRFLR